MSAPVDVPKGGRKEFIDKTVADRVALEEAAYSIAARIGSGYDVDPAEFVVFDHLGLNKRKVDSLPLLMERVFETAERVGSAQAIADLESEIETNDDKVQAKRAELQEQIEKLQTELRNVDGAANMKRRQLQEKKIGYEFLRSRAPEFIKTRHSRAIGQLKSSDINADLMECESQLRFMETVSTMNLAETGRAQLEAMAITASETFPELKLDLGREMEKGRFPIAEWNKLAEQARERVPHLKKDLANFKEQFDQAKAEADLILDYWLNEYQRFIPE